MILSFNKETKEQDDFNDDSLKIDTINEIEELLSKQSKYFFNYFHHRY
jgi:hypothetical protein